MKRSIVWVQLAHCWLRQLKAGDLRQEDWLDELLVAIHVIRKIRSYEDRIAWIALSAMAIEHLTRKPNPRRAVVANGIKLAIASTAHIPSLEG